MYYNTLTFSIILIIINFVIKLLLTLWTLNKTTSSPIWTVTILSSRITKLTASYLNAASPPSKVSCKLIQTPSKMTFKETLSKKVPAWFAKRCPWTLRSVTAVTRSYVSCVSSSRLSRMDIVLSIRSALTAKFRNK